VISLHLISHSSQDIVLLFAGSDEPQNSELRNLVSRNYTHRSAL